MFLKLVALGLTALILAGISNLHRMVRFSRVCSSR
jgi:hypothetical protein